MARPQAATTPKFETEVGTPNGRSPASHTTAASAKTRIIGALENMRDFGATYAADTKAAAVQALSEVNATNLPSLPRDEWRGWQVRDEHTGTTLVVRIRRIAS